MTLRWSRDRLVQERSFKRTARGIGKTFGAVVCTFPNICMVSYCWLVVVELQQRAPNPPDAAAVDDKVTHDSDPQESSEAVSEGHQD